MKYLPWLLTPSSVCSLDTSWSGDKAGFVNLAQHADLALEVGFGTLLLQEIYIKI